jgi:hypothetical protein
MLTIDKLREFGADVDEGLSRCMKMEDFYIGLVKKAVAESDTGFHVYRAHPETPERNIEPNGGRPDDVSVYLYPLFRRVIIFEPATKEEERDVIQTSMKENKEEALRRRRHALIDAAYDEEIPIRE